MYPNDVQHMLSDSPDRMQPVSSKEEFDIHNDMNMNVYRIENSNSGGSEESLIQPVSPILKGTGGKMMQDDQEMPSEQTFMSRRSGGRNIQMPLTQDFPHDDSAQLIDVMHAGVGTQDFPEITSDNTATLRRNVASESGTNSNQMLSIRGQY